MKTLSKSSIFAALVALFLSISLSGCFEEGTKTASKGGETGYSVFQTVKEGVPDSGGIATFRFPRGVREIGVTYVSTKEADRLLPQLKETLAAAGIRVTSLDRIGSDISISVDPLKEDITIKIDTTSVSLLKPYKRSGVAFQWIPVEGFV